MDQLYEALRPKVERLSTALGGATVSVAVSKLDGTYDLDINGDHVGYAASVIKVPVMVEALRQVEQGTLELGQCLDCPQGMSYRSTGAFRDVMLYKLLRSMIVFSHNNATNAIANTIGLYNINDEMERRGLHDTRMHHLILGKGDYDEGSNTTTAREMAELLKQIYTSEGPFREFMITMLKLARPRNLGMYLPRVEIGGKPGIIEDCMHEIGVIDRDYAISVMMFDLPTAYEEVLGSDLLKFRARIDDDPINPDGRYEIETPSGSIAVQGIRRISALVYYFMNELFPEGYYATT